MEKSLQTKQIAELIAAIISNNSSSERHSPKWQAIKMQKEKQTSVNFTSDKSEEHNLPFLLLELKHAIHKPNE